MAKCKRVQDGLSDYIEGTLSGESLREVEDHIKICQQCKMLSERMHSTIQLLGSLPDISTSDTFELKLRQRIREARSSERNRFRKGILSFPLFRPVPAFSLSAAVVLIGAVVFLFRGSLFPEKQPLIFVNGADQTKIERLSAPSESTGISNPYHVVNEASVPAGMFDPRQQYHSPFWDVSSDDQLAAEDDWMIAPQYGQHTVRYVLPSAQPQVARRTVTFNP